MMFSMRLKLIFGALFGILLAALAHATPADAAVCSQQTLWTTGATITAATLNADPLYLYGTCLQNLDHTNIGSAGIYPSQTIPTNSTNATVGGSIAWIYPNGISVTGGANITGTTSINGALLATDVNLNSVAALPVPTPRPAATMIVVGDSIAYGKNATTCARTGLSPTGTCWSDRVANFWGLREVNQGVIGAVFETCTVYADCNFQNSIVQAFNASALSYCGNNNNQFFIDGGVNDAIAMVAYGPQGTNAETFSGATFQAAATSMINSCTAAGTPRNHIWLIGPPLLSNALSGTASPYSPYYQGYVNEFAAAMARAAHLTGVNFIADGPYQANFVNGATTIWSDGLHPSDYGYGLIANAIEAGYGMEGTSYAGAYDVLQQVENANGLNVPGPIFAGQYGTSTPISASGVISGNGLNADLANTANGNGASPNPVNAWFNNGAGDIYGAELYQLPSNSSFGTGFVEPSIGSGWDFLNYTLGSYPSAQSGFSVVANIDQIGDINGRTLSAGPNFIAGLAAGAVQSGSSASTGVLALGGNTSYGTLDYGSTYSGYITSSRIFDAPQLVAGSALTGVAGLASGAIESTQGLSAGTLVMGGSTSYATLDYGATTPSIGTFSKPLTVLGALTASNLNIGSGTAMGYGAISHCGFTDNSFAIYNGSSFNLSGDTSGDVGVCGALNTVGAETVGGALTANAGFIVAAGGEAITGSSSITGSDTIGTGLIVSAGGMSINGASIIGGSLSVGSGTGATLLTGDVGASRSTTTGEMVIGGSSSSCPIDFGVTVASTLYANCIADFGSNVNVAGAEAVTGTLSTAGVTILPKKGQTTCTLSAATTCNATATVVAGSTCSASYNSATTVTFTSLQPLEASVSGTTLTIKNATSVSASTAFTDDYVCI